MGLDEKVSIREVVARAKSLDLPFKVEGDANTVIYDIGGVRFGYWVPEGLTRDTFNKFLLAIGARYPEKSNQNE